MYLQTDYVFQTFSGKQVHIRMSIFPNFISYYYIVAQWELHNVYSSLDVIRQIKSRIMMGGARGIDGRGGKFVQGFGGKAQGKKTTCKPKE
jgi:hypothetical protein